MSEFCEPCPLRGECEGEVDVVIVKDVRNIYKAGQRMILGRFAVAIDTNGDPSEPITYSERFSPGIIEKELMTKLEDRTCNQPIKSTFFEPKHCGMFNTAGTKYEDSPAAFIESKEHFLGRVLSKYRNIKRAE